MTLKEAAKVWRDSYSVAIRKAQRGQWPYVPISEGGFLLPKDGVHYRVSGPRLQAIINGEQVA